MAFAEDGGADSDWFADDGLGGVRAALDHRGYAGDRDAPAHRRPGWWRVLVVMGEARILLLGSVARRGPAATALTRAERTSGTADLGGAFGRIGLDLFVVIASNVSGGGTPPRDLR